MRNYIRAELYRAMNRPLMWGFIIGTIALGWSFIGLSAYSNSFNQIRIQFDELMHMGISSITVVGFLVVIYIESVLSEDLRTQTAKNVLISGLSREKFYLAKLVVESVLGIITLVVISTALVSMSWIALPKGPEAKVIIETIVKIILTLIPLCIGCIGYGNLLGLFIKNTTAIAFVYPMSLAFTNIIFMVLGKLVSEGFDYINQWMLYTQIARIANMNISDKTLVFAAIVGVVNLIVWGIIGVIVVKKQEIK